MDIEALLSKIKTAPESIEFNQVIETIDSHYTYIPAEFVNGENLNEAGTNEGSCKIFAFAKLHQLTAIETLHCFGDYYRADVLQHPENTDHANIRQFMIHGWDGIQFKTRPLVKMT